LGVAAARVAHFSEQTPIAQATLTGMLLASEALRAFDPEESAKGGIRRKINL